MFLKKFPRVKTFIIYFYNFFYPFVLIPLMPYMVVSLITNTSLLLESVCLDLFGIVLGIVLKYVFENVMNDFP